MVFEPYIEDVVDQLNVTYIYGDFEETREKIMKVSLNKQKDGTRYPLILLQSDNNEQRKGVNPHIATDVTVRMFFITKSKIEYSTKQRDTEVYGKVLYPLMGRFFEALEENRYFLFNQTDLNEMQHTVTHRYYKRSDKEGTQQNKIKDIVEAIELVITLKIKNYHE